MTESPNHAWARALVGELVASGVEEFVVSPGSRSAPLAIAARLHRGARVRVILDERSAAFFALGIAKAKGPAAVVTTSGTAVANLMPAVVEADLCEAPLVAITADRPPELIDVGANQAIRQPHLFGSSVRWALHLPLPDLRPELVRHLRASACRAAAVAKTGPVHVNVPFREPLAPTPEDLGAIEPHAPFTAWLPTAASAHGLEGAFKGQGLIVAAARVPLPLLERVSRHLEAPVLADGLGPRHGHNGGELVLTSPRFAGIAADWILQVGRPTGKRVRSYLAAHQGRRIVVDRAGRDEWGASHMLPLAPEAALEAVLRVPKGRRDSAWRERWGAAQKAAAVPLGPPDWEGPLVAALAPKKGVAWVASSLPVRDWDRFAARGALANRGASGIDGTVSSAAGAAGDGPGLLYVGDLAFQHDVGALAAVARYAPNLSIVVANNHGGRIFDQLPVAKALPRRMYEELFATPQHFAVGKACEAFGVPYRNATVEGAKSAAREAGVVEVTVDPVTSLGRRAEHEKRVVAALAEL
ncbi:MAG: 2-succinyl-5-enolpyruvyl-6-hydroxy-3-cyclohexene-1-carboxylic-acid synthase [Thermoplasmatota archaeon]